MTESLLVKADGSSKSAVERASRIHRYSGPLHFIFCRSIVPPATLYRHLKSRVQAVREELEASLNNEMMVRLHWLDNYAKHFASNSMFSNRELFKSCLWTAHALKQLPFAFNMSWKQLDSGDSSPSLPNIDELLSEGHLEQLTHELLLLARPYYAESIAVVRDVLRIPLKVVETADEVGKVHLDRSSDGLKYFIPVDIYSDNITTTMGLINSFHRLQLIEGFGIPHHRRSGQYSLLHVDVKIFWQLFRVLYSYPAFAGIRHDLFLLFGFWHAYHYAHVALWDEFRATFLAAAFWKLYPTQNIMRRPKLSQSSTFFMWLRLAYPSFREKLNTSMKDAPLQRKLNIIRQSQSGVLVEK